VQREAEWRCRAWSLCFDAKSRVIFDFVVKCPKIFVNAVEERVGDGGSHWQMFSEIVK
jgi:hypothetical protein